MRRVHPAVLHFCTRRGPSYRPVRDVGSSEYTSRRRAAVAVPPSGKRTDAVAAVPGARGLPGGDADLLHHPGAAGDPRPRRGPPGARARTTTSRPSGCSTPPGWPCRTGRSSGAARTGRRCSATSGARRCSWPACPEPLAFNTSMIGPVLAAFGNQEQKERFLPKTANLDIWWCQGFSEPDAGSDLASLRTTAVRDGDDWVVNGQKTWTTLGQHADWIFCLVPHRPDRGEEAARHLAAGLPDGLPRRHAAPDRADRRRLRGQRGLLRGRPRAGGEPRRRGEPRLGLRQVPARQRAGRHRPRRRHQAAAGPGQGARRARSPSAAGRSPRTRAWPRASPSSRTSSLALELTALRVVANSADGKPHPASSVLKLRGSELQQAATELVVDIAGPLSLASFADEGSDVPDWARRRDAALPELPQGLHLRRLQRGAAHHHRRLDPGVVRQP